MLFSSSVLDLEHVKSNIEIGLKLKNNSIRISKEQNISELESTVQQMENTKTKKVC